MAMGTGEWMEPPIPDGLPVTDYPHQLPNGLPVGYYSPHCSTDCITPPESARLPTHTQNLSEYPRKAFAQPVLGHQPSDALPQTLMSPSVSSCGDAPSAHGSPWSATDHETELDGYSYHSSPLSADVPTYNQALISPVPWSSPMQIPFRKGDEQSFQQARMCSPISNGSPHVVQTTYPHTSHPFGTPAHSPLMSVPAPGGFAPPSPEGPFQGYTPEVKEEEGDEGRGHEPYSKQLVRALMSFPGHAATVQQLYEWFKKNTSRHENTGWRNSIRHNLSLNEAFGKRVRPAAEGEDASPSGAAKRGNEWFLKDWAATGVQSTAKYRPKNKGSKIRPRQESFDSPGMACRPGAPGRKSSGHRGGCATSRMKRRRQSHSVKEEYVKEEFVKGEFAQAQWGGIPEGVPLTPASTPEQFGIAVNMGAGLVDASYGVPQGIDLSGYQLGDVAGVWDGGRLFASDFRNLHEQLQ